MSPQCGSHGGPPEGNLHGHVFGHTVRPHLVARFLEAQLESRFAFKLCWFFDPCHPGWLPFRFIVGSIVSPFWNLWAPFCIILEPFGVHWASFEGSSEEGCFFIYFWRPKWSQSGASKAPKNRATRCDLTVCPKTWPCSFPSGGPP